MLHGLTMIIKLLLMNLLMNGQTAQSLNFLLIVVDDLRPALGCYGDENAYTPNIDKLAENSALFGRAYAQQSLCAPSRTSFLTSRRPDTLQLYDFYSYWRDTVGNFTTVPQHLKNHGYRTKSIGKIFHPGKSSNFSDDSPYSWTDNPFHPRTNRYKNAPVCPCTSTSSPASNLVCPVSVDSMPGETLPDLEILKAATLFIENQINDDRPFFLAVGFEKPHIPLKYPHEYLRYHPLSKFNVADPYKWPTNISNVAYNPWTDIRERDDVRALGLKFPWEKIPVEFAKRIKQSYYAAVTYIDDLIGKLLDKLRFSKFYENTVVVLTSDHGWSLGEHAEWAKYSNFEVALGVPLIIWNPRKKEPRAKVTVNGRSGSLYPISEIKEIVNDYIEGSERKTSKDILQFENSVNSIRRENLSTAKYKIFRDKANVIRIDAMVELVDIFPTIAELAGTPIPVCPRQWAFHGTESSLVNPCTEGISLLPLIEAAMENEVISWKSAAFSQYPRPGLEPTLKPNSDKPRLSDITIMGYTLRTSEYRYTAWIPFFPNTKKPDWNRILAEELYNHNIDSNEIVNVAVNPTYDDVKKELRTLLRYGWRKALPKRI